MTKLSISKAWDESRAVLARDSSLLTAVALALLVLPGVVSDLVTPAAPAGELPPVGPWMLVALVVLVVGLIGQLAVLRLVLGSRVTVGQAIAHGARRVFPYIAAMLMWLLPFAVVIAVLLQSSGRETVPPAVLLVSILLMVTLLYLFIRFIFAAPVAAAESVGPVQILKRSWEMTRRNWWRLFGFVLLLLIVVIFVMGAVGAVTGVIVGLLFGNPEPMSVGSLIISLVTQTVGAVITVVFLVMLARLYLQPAAGEEPEASVPNTGS